MADLIYAVAPYVAVAIVAALLHKTPDGVAVRGKTMIELDSDCLREVVKASGFMEHAKPDEDIVAYVKRIAAGVKTPDGEQR